MVNSESWAVWMIDTAFKVLEIQTTRHTHHSNSIGVLAVPSVGFFLVALQIDKDEQIHVVFAKNSFQQ